MGHDEHFLSRLDRVKRPTVEFALALYRDPGLVRALLASPLIPENAPRVAVSLGDTQAGPFVVVARDGHFVTCLGEGMFPRGLPVLPRDVVDGLIRRTEAARAARRLAEHEVGRQGKLGQLLARLYWGGEFLSREEALAVRFWAPAILTDLWGIFTSFLDTTAQASLNLAAERHPDAGLQRERLQRFFHGTWACLHLGTIVADCDNSRTLLETFRAVPGVPDAAVLLPTVTWEIMRMGTLGASMRAAWINARLGRFALGAQKQWLRGDETVWRAYSAGYAFAALATRQSRLRAEVLKLADGLAGNADPAPAAVLRAHLGKAVGDCVRDPAAARAWGERRGRTHVLDITREMGTKEGWNVRTPEEVPADLVVAGVVDCTWTTFPQPTAALEHLPAVALVAPASLGDLYFPRSFQAMFDREWSDARALAWLRPAQEWHRLRAPRPVVRAETPGRNDPCPCASGKKYKKCCAA